MEKKYELIREGQLYRIRALRDIPRYRVEAGDFGGRVDRERNLDQEGDCWIGPGAYVGGNSLVWGESYVGGNAYVTGDVHVGECARVDGAAYMAGKVFARGTSHISGNIFVTGDDVDITGNAQISGAFQINRGIAIGGEAAIDHAGHILTATIMGDYPHDSLLYRTRTGHTLEVSTWAGCWEGTVEEFKELITAGAWLDEEPETLDAYLPELLAFINLCQARIDTWAK